ncbi:MAG TPA: adenosylcobalamin-dependent ribonucleoside-diphosphate reductase [Thiotrichales bacterium]|nr:adenosylcobalamin-dependent ribonucleoside-diphosphate reductase [Thiotrichales bacterium]
MSESPFIAPISELIWDTRYRYRDGESVHDRSIGDTWRRVARALAAAEAPAGRARWEEAFLGLLEDFRFLPGGRILAGAGTGRRVTLFNCFVMGVIEDSMEGIFEALKEGALTMQQGGGVGYDFSTLRPQGARAWSVGGVASGPVSFMRIWDSMCATLLSTGARRGAMMATLRCDHPDIQAFIDAKRDPRELRHFNLSVLVTDDFMEAVRQDEDWPLVFPLSRMEEAPPGTGTEMVEREWPGQEGRVPCRVIRVVRARELWDHLMRASYDYAEPGVLFIDRINHWNNLGYAERISATNPCGEIPLPPYGACDLGSLNLVRFVLEPFTPQARMDFQGLEQAAAIAVRMLDNVIDVSQFPLPAQRERVRSSRRVGLGITGLADALMMLGIRYGTPESQATAAEIMRHLCHAAYRASIGLAAEKGAFPALDRQAHLERPFIRALPEDIREGIAEQGIRNSHLLAIAPTGTISLLANNVSSGLEPVFQARYRRRLQRLDGSREEHEVVDYACRLWQAQHGTESLPPAFVDARSLAPENHLAMQAALQPYVDNAISKTINIPECYDFEAYRSVFERAYELGLKGCTAFRPNPVTGSVLEAEGTPPQAHCCSIDREAD